MRIAAGIGALAAAIAIGHSLAGCSEDELGTSTNALRICADGPTVDGIDVSHHQGEINWHGVKNGGQVFAFIRVSDGTKGLDKTFDYNWKEAKKAGIIRGVYQFFRVPQDPTAQADLLIKRVKEAGGVEPGDLPPVIDLEVTDGADAETVQQNALAWVQRIEQAFRIKPIVYTGNNMKASVGTSLNKYLLWVPNYTSDCPLTPDAWKKWTFWQKSEKGQIEGITDTNVDLDVFNGSLADLKALTIKGAGATTADAGEAGAPDEATLAIEAGAGRQPDEADMAQQ